MHWFCFSCAKRHVDGKGTCPICVQPVKFIKKRVRPARAPEAVAVAAHPEPPEPTPAGGPSCVDGDAAASTQDVDGDAAMATMLESEAELILYFARDMEAHPDASLKQRLERIGPGILLRSDADGDGEYAPVTLAQARKACSKAKRAHERASRLR